MSALEIIDVCCEYSSACLLGESARWLADEQALYWVDIKRPAFFRYCPDSGDASIWPAPEMMSAFAPRQVGGFLGAFASGLHSFVLPGDGSVMKRELIARPANHASSDRFNDGVCHPDGSFWVGTMDDAEKVARGWFYRLDPNGDLVRVSGPHMVCNGPAFSPDGKVAYLTDSAARTIYMRDASVASSPNKVFVRLDEQDGYPDGMAVDTEGRLWIACWDGGKIICLDSSGVRQIEIPMPVSRPTSCTFGGENLDTLFVTSAKIGLSAEALAAQPLAGNLFSVRLKGAQGLHTARFGG
jgi:sugar lactone lactonase YvrE